LSLVRDNWIPEAY